MTYFLHFRWQEASYQDYTESLHTVLIFSFDESKYMPAWKLPYCLSLLSFYLYFSVSHILMYTHANICVYTHRLWCSQPWSEELLPEAVNADSCCLRRLRISDSVCSAAAEWSTPTSSHPRLGDHFGSQRRKMGRGAVNDVFYTQHGLYTHEVKGTRGTCIRSPQYKACQNVPMVREVGLMMELEELLSWWLLWDGKSVALLLAFCVSMDFHLHMSSTSRNRDGIILCKLRRHEFRRETCYVGVVGVGSIEVLQGGIWGRAWSKNPTHTY